MLHYAILHITYTISLPIHKAINVSSVTLSSRWPSTYLIYRDTYIYMYIHTAKRNVSISYRHVYYILYTRLYILPDRHIHTTTHAYTSYYYLNIGQCLDKLINSLLL